MASKCDCDSSSSDDCEISDDECNSENPDCGELDWNVVIRQITECKINECGKKKCKKARIIEDRSHEQVCFWNQLIPTYLRYYGDMSDGSGFKSFPLNQPLKFIASGNTLVIQATSPCVTDSLSFNNGVIIIPPCDQTPQRRPGHCNMTVTFSEVAYFVDVSSYDSVELRVGTTIKAVNGGLVFENHEIHCLCDLEEYQKVLQQTEHLKLNQGTQTSTASGRPGNGGRNAPPPQ